MGHNEDFVCASERQNGALLCDSVLFELGLVEPEIGLVGREKMDLSVGWQLADVDVDSL